MKLSCKRPRSESPQQENVNATEHIKYMKVLEEAVRRAVQYGRNKEREVFASLVVKDSKVISLAVNEVLNRRDATATSEVLAIRNAAKFLGTYVLTGCTMYSTMEPDVMSLGAILWSRIDKLYYGLSQQIAARFGFEEGLLQFRELFASPGIVDEVFSVETGIGSKICEEVFQEWKKCNAIIY